MNVQTGDDVKEDQLLASIDPRIPRNNWRSRRRTSRSRKRSSTMPRRSCAVRHALQIAGHHANRIRRFQAGLRDAYAAVIAPVGPRDSRDRMTDTKLRAPLGTIIIPRTSSSARDLIADDGTWRRHGALKMANLDTVQIRAPRGRDGHRESLAGPATITVDAYPNRRRGVVLKVEPQATVQQTSRCSSAGIRFQIRITCQAGHEHRVEITSGAGTMCSRCERALRTQPTSRRRRRCWGSIRTTFASSSPRRNPAAANAGDRDQRVGWGGGARSLTRQKHGRGTRWTTPDGRTIQLPPGGPSADQIGFPETHVGQELTRLSRARWRRCGR